MRGEKGITLVALVVTIVVLLILAGITITYVLSDGGIFGRASQAAQEQKMAALRDYMSNAISDAKIDDIYAKYVKGTTDSTTTAAAIIERNFPATNGLEADGTHVKYTGTVNVTDGKLTGTITIKSTDKVAHTFQVDFTNSKVTDITV
ncbi:MAG: type II secretion system protein [Clostridia bacterium]|nr:type II secretion system protein [Clostridia bacterium]